MKNLINLLGFIIVLISCSEKEDFIFVDQSCGIKNPTENIVWLKELVNKAENDTTGNFFGTIYLEEYNGSDVIFVQMPMYSGGVYGYWYNCDGTELQNYDSSLTPVRKKVIYSNVLK